MPKTKTSNTRRGNLVVGAGIAAIFIFGMAIGALFIAGLHRTGQIGAHAPTVEMPDTRTCAVIEEIIMDALVDTNRHRCHAIFLHNAQMYAKLAESGCPENHAAFAARALQNLEIARAMRGDRFYNVGEARDVIDTYRRLNMQREAEAVFNRIKQLTNPAIDFIMAVEDIFRR